MSADHKPDEDFKGIVPPSIKKAMENSGKITVKLWRVELGKKVKGNNKAFKNLKPNQSIPEAALKGKAASLETR